MPRPEKVQAVVDIKEHLEGSTAVFLAEYAGLSVGEQQELRRGLRAAGSELKIVKMTLARIAATELGHDDLVADLRGPTALAFASGEAAAAAKVLRDFAKDHDQLILKGGLLDGEPLTAARVGQLADLDSREVLLAKIAGAFEAPISGLAGLMAALPRNLASMVLQLIGKLPPEETEAEASEPEAPEAEAESATVESETDEAVSEAEVIDAPEAEESAADEAVSEPEVIDAPEAEESAADEAAPEDEEAPEPAGDEETLETATTEDLNDEAAPEASDEVAEAATDDDTAEAAEEE